MVIKTDTGLSQITVLSLCGPGYLSALGVPAEACFLPTPELLTWSSHPWLLVTLRVRSPVTCPDSADLPLLQPMGGSLPPLQSSLFSRFLIPVTWTSRKIVLWLLILYKYSPSWGAWAPLLGWIRAHPPQPWETQSPRPILLLTLALSSLLPQQWGVSLLGTRCSNLRSVKSHGAHPTFLHMCWDPSFGQDKSSFPWSFWQIKAVAGWSLKCPLTSLDFKELGLSPATGLSLHLPHVRVSESLAQSKLCCQSFCVHVTEETATLSFYMKWLWSPETLLGEEKADVTGE